MGTDEALLFAAILQVISDLFQMMLPLVFKVSVASPVCLVNFQYAENLSTKNLGCHNLVILSVLKYCSCPTILQTAVRKRPRRLVTHQQEWMFVQRQFATLLI